ncbi:phage terminase large subunit, partial [Enterobacter bugandensis]|uniref:phage terminase large subunit n=2 Tax=Enterobacteriaceae TaxID=543 RepID=UPI0035C62573
APELETNFKAFISQAWRKNREAGTLRKIYVEDKSSGTALIQNLEKKLPIKINALQRNKDKVTRAMDVLPVVKAQRVYLPADASFSSEFIAEHSAFTYDDTHDHDDIVDNLIDAVTEELLLGSDALRRLKALAS